MKDNRDKQIAQLAGWTWDMAGYAAKVPFYNADDLTMREVQSVFQLDPEPRSYRNAEADRVPQKEQKTAAAVYLYQVDNDGEWGEIRFDFENGTAEIAKLADWDTIKSNVFAKTAIRYVQSLPEVRMLRFVVVPFESETLGK